MGHGLPVRLSLHEPLDLVPGPGPVEAQRDLPGRRARVLGHHLLDLVQTFGVMGDELVEATLEVGEPVLVGGKDLLGREVLELGQRVQEVPQGIGDLLGVGRDVRGDAGQDVVPRDEQVALVTVEAHVPGGVTRGPDGAQRPSG